MWVGSGEADVEWKRIEGVSPQAWIREDVVTGTGPC